VYLNPIKGLIGQHDCVHHEEKIHKTVSRMSSVASSSVGERHVKVNKGPTRRGMAMALADIKEYMNESQKATIYMREAKALMDGGEFLEATECLDEAISLTPHQVSFYLSRAACHKALHLYTEAYYDYTFL